MPLRVLVAALLLGGMLFFWAFKPVNGALALGQQVPSFAVPGEAGQTYQPQDFRGKLLLINFWSTTCGPCVEEIPSLNALYRQYHDKGLEIIGINVDGAPAAMADALQKFRARVPIAFPVAFDASGAVADAYGTFRLPETYLVDSAGRLLRKVVGAVDWSHGTVRSEIERQLPK